MPTSKPHVALMTAMKSLHLSEKYADFAIKCGDDKYPIHKAIVCPRSEFFDAATRFGKEAEDKVVDLSNDEPNIVTLMIQYFYNLDYDIPGTVSTQSLSVRYEPIDPVENDIPTHIRLAEDLANLDEKGMSEAVKVVQDHYPKTERVGHAYLLDILPVEVSNIIEARCADENPGSWKPWKPEALQCAPIIHAKMYTIADKYNIIGLKELAIDKFMVASEDHFTNQGFYDAIEIIYTTTMEDDLGLRDIVAEYIRDNIELWGLYPRAEKLLKSVPDLAFRVMKKHFGAKGCGFKGRS